MTDGDISAIGDQIPKWEGEKGCLVQEDEVEDGHWKPREGWLDFGGFGSGGFFSLDNVKAFCYKVKKMVKEAKQAYKEALKVEPELVVAREVVHRLVSSG